MGYIHIASINYGDLVFYFIIHRYAILIYPQSLIYKHSREHLLATYDLKMLPLKRITICSK